MMSFRNNGFRIEKVKKIDMVEYLSGLGHEPSKIRGVDHWYLSPLREEKTPSFKINSRLNRWYDHGLARGGNLIDFAILYFDCSVSEFLQKLNGESSLQKQGYRHPRQEALAESKIINVKESELASYSLLRYLEQRKIPAGIARQFCREVRYEVNGKIFYGIGFKNDSGGYEIRNPYFKSSSSPKDITTIRNGAENAFVFEGFFDFLSFITIHKNRALTENDFVILNSAAFFEKARLFMEQHKVIHLYLDRDTTGQHYSRYALSLGKKYKDESSLYEHHKDLNDWLMNFGRAKKKSLCKKLKYGR